ncbi:MAG TPA: glycerophosphodiester phosphodiesterase [Candidatus Deferrimicrobiaceae bacterium]|nr:glycerophosphodiester phosphodiesterase [Candidatus Deferrimicrobiaceae bacterium]
MSALRLAHRGDWRVAPENSLGAMRAALAIPACDGLEFDVRASADGVPVLLHDDSLARVQRVEVRCADLPAAALARHGLPTLESVLALSVGGDGRPEPFLAIELKAIVPAALPLIDAFRGEPDGSLRRALVSTFYPDVMDWLARERPGWRRWANVFDLEPATVDAVRDLGCRGLSSEWRAIDARRLDRAAAAGLDVAAWTVRRRDTFRRLERLGVVAIFAEAAALDA